MLLKIVFHNSSHFMVLKDYSLFIYLFILFSNCVFVSGQANNHYLLNYLFIFLNNISPKFDLLHVCI